MKKGELKFIVCCCIGIIIWAVMAIQIINLKNQIQQRTDVVVKILSK